MSTNFVSYRTSSLGAEVSQDLLDRFSQSLHHMVFASVMSCDPLLDHMTCCSTECVVSFNWSAELSCAVIGAELALKPSLNAKLVPAHARGLMDVNSGGEVPSAGDVAGGGAGASSSLG